MLTEDFVKKAYSVVRQSPKGLVYFDLNVNYLFTNKKHNWPIFHSEIAELRLFGWI